jgi:hypothetical protein
MELSAWTAMVAPLAAQTIEGDRTLQMASAPTAPPLSTPSANVPWSAVVAEMRNLPR